MNTANQVQPEERRLICQLYRMGISRDALSKRFKRAKTTIDRIVKTTKP